MLEELIEISLEKEKNLKCVQNQYARPVFKLFRILVLSNRICFHARGQWLEHFFR